MALPEDPEVDCPPSPEAWISIAGWRPLVVLVSDDHGRPSLPAAVTVHGASHALATHRYQSGPWDECRHGARRLHLVHTLASVVIPAAGTGHLAIVWVPVDTDGASALDELLPAVATIRARWALALVDGTWRPQALEADGSLAATRALAAWPAGWRLPAAGDPDGGPWTGPRYLGLVAGDPR